MKKRAAHEAKLKERYLKLKGNLTERARRLFVANEAIAFGYGGIAAAARATGIAPSVIGRGIEEVRAIEAGRGPDLPPTHSRRPGAGRKKATENKAVPYGVYDELAIPISVCHLPPGTSKWNKIEHRLFCHITKNWRGRPLRTFETVVELIGHTRTATWSTGSTKRMARP